jgi:tetratricopeptide (TPR) repeat protein
MKKRQNNMSQCKNNKWNKAFYLQLGLFMVIFLSIASCSLPRIIVLEDPLSPEEHLNLGVTYEMNGELDSALEQYKIASKTLPRAYTYMGNIYFQKGDFRKSETSYKKAIKKDPFSADAYNNLAWLYFTKKKNLDVAEEYALRALELDPSKKDIYQDTLDQIREHKRAVP